MPKQTLKHVHTYVRLGMKFGELYYKCNHPDCTHMAPVSVILGKRSICSICEVTEFILTRRDLKMVSPKGPCCSNQKKFQEHRRLQELVGGLLGEGQS